MNYISSHAISSVSANEKTSSFVFAVDGPPLILIADDLTPQRYIALELIASAQ